MRHCGKCNNSGQALVETAMGIVALLAFLFGILNMGAAIYAYNWVSFAAREGTRYAAVHGSTSPSPISSSGYSALTNLITGEAQGLTGTLTVTPTWPTDNKPGSVVKVQVQYHFSFAMPFVTLSPITLSSTSQMVISR